MNLATPIPEAEAEIRKLYNKKGYDRGITLYNSLDKNYELWGKINVSWPNGQTKGPDYDVLHPVTKKSVKVPERGWRWTKETFDRLLDYRNIIKLHDGTYTCGQIWFDKDENTQPSLVKYLKDVETLLLRSIISLKSDGGLEVEELLGGKNIMPYPKPTELIKLLVNSVQETDFIILDFFAGSATTAHAVLDLNKQDNGNRKFICVQLPEPCAEDSESFKAGYRTIADIGKERIRRVIKKLHESDEGKLDLDNSQDLDRGFRVLKLDQSNFRQWQQLDATATPEQIAEQLDLHIDHINHKATQEDLLFEILLKAGFKPTEKVSLFSAADKQVFSIVAEGSLLICLEESVTKELIDAVIEANPQQFICLDSAFHGNDQLKANAVQTFNARNMQKEKHNQIVFRTV